jgi:uncharacterized membrane protein YdjX (TVP38/TMEM64 family)
MRYRALLLAAAAASLIAIASSDVLHGAVLALLDTARALVAEHPVAGPVAFVVLAALSSMLAFFSSAVLVPAAVHAWGGVATAALLWLGWTLGGLAAYTIAARFGRPLLRWVAPTRSLAPYEAMLARHGSFGSILLFQLALPSELPGYILGFARYPLRRYLAVLVVAEIPYAVVTMLIGTSFVERRVGVLLIVGAAAALATLVLTRELHRRLTH